jgi:virulence-associated protein VagC
VRKKLKEQLPVRIRVGTPVRVRFPAGTVAAVVVEDRGFLGPRGQQVVRVRATEETDFPADFEIPVGHVEVLGPPVTGRAA